MNFIFIISSIEDTRDEAQAREAALKTINSAIDKERKRIAMVHYSQALKNATCEQFTEANKHSLAATIVLRETTYSAYSYNCMKIDVPNVFSHQWVQLEQTKSFIQSL